MILLTSEEKELQRNQKVCYIFKNGFSTHDNNKKYHKVKEHCVITLENIEGLLMLFVI